MSGQKYDVARLLREFAGVFRAAQEGTSTVEQDNRGCEIIETLMRRERERLDSQPTTVSQKKA